MNGSDNKPLVSVIIITYNSSAYILDTLESIRRQTYSNIELIVTDDCSVDNTVTLCSEWLLLNKDRFHNTIMVTSEKNTGVAPNVWRGLLAAHGKWIKELAGDDMLFAQAIEEYVKFAASNNCDICCAKLKMFGDEELVKKSEAGYESLYLEIDKDLKYQQKTILRRLFIPGPGIFYSKKLMNYREQPSSKYPFADEWPFFSRIIIEGYKIYLLNQHLVYYRLQSGSLCHGELGMHSRVFRDMRKYFLQEGFWHLIKHGDLLYAWDQLILYNCINIKYNTKNNSLRYRYANLLLILSPLAVLRRIKKALKRKTLLYYSPPHVRAGRFRYAGLRAVERRAA